MILIEIKKRKLIVLWIFGKWFKVAATWEKRDNVIGLKEMTESTGKNGIRNNVKNQFCNFQARSKWSPRHQTWYLCPKFSET